MTEEQCPVCYAYLDFNGHCPVCAERSHVTSIANSRSRRNRVIKKRIRIIQSIWRAPEIIKNPGYYAKQNLSCNCFMCKPGKKMGIEKPKYQLSNSLTRNEIYTH